MNQTISIYFKSTNFREMFYMSHVDKESLLLERARFLRVFDKLTDSGNDVPIIFSQKIIDELDKFVEDNPDPEMHLLKFCHTIKKNISIGETFFIFLDYDLMDENEQFELFRTTESILRNDSGFSEKMDLLSEYRLSYKSYVFGNVKSNIGAENKCRFCNRTKADGVKFGKEAHAISEALGNKLVISNEECDDCNEKFSVQLESAIVKYFSIYRTLYGIRGKGGLKKIKEKNFELQRDPNVRKMLEDQGYHIPSDLQDFDIENVPPLKLVLIDKDLDPNDKSDKVEYNMDFGKINLQDVYRCLCKYAISVMPEEYLGNFMETIKWINREISLDKTPFIRICKLSKMVEQPHITVNLRKSDNSNLPYCFCEFNFTSLLVIFLIPLDAKNTQDFTNEENLRNFWMSPEMKYFRQFSGWKFDDFSNDKKAEFSKKLEICHKTKNITLID